MKKKCKVVMLPTNEKATVGSIVTRPFDNRMAIVNVLTKDDTQPRIHQHLYILSDEEIKEDDWFIDITPMNYGIVYQSIGLSKSKDFERWIKSTTGVIKEPITQCKKIIAITDSSLKIPYDGKTTISKNWNGYSLPQPTPEFIQQYVDAYNSGNPIEEVEVEYEEYAVGNYGMSDGEPTIDERLKVNSENQVEITIPKSDVYVEELAKEYANNSAKTNYEEGINVGKYQGFIAGYKAAKQQKLSLKELCKQDSDLRKEVIDTIKTCFEDIGEMDLTTDKRINNWISENI